MAGRSSARHILIEKQSKFITRRKVQKEGKNIKSKELP